MNTQIIKDEVLKKTSSLFIHKLVHVLMFGGKRVNL